MTRFQLTVEESNQLRAVYATDLANFKQNREEKGVFAASYDTLIAILDAADASRFDDESRIVQKWIVGARNVNSGDGLFTDFIREYTIFQRTKRLGEAPPNAEDLAQEASNGVARNFLGDVLNLAAADGGALSIPSLRDTGFNDAGAAASTVFDYNRKGEYAPWAGTLLFSFLGYDGFFDDWLLNYPLVTSSEPLVEMDGSGTDREVAQEPGTYNLIAAIWAGYAATRAGIHQLGYWRNQQARSQPRGLMMFGDMNGTGRQCISTSVLTTLRRRWNALLVREQKSSRSSMAAIILQLRSVAIRLATGFAYLEKRRASNVYHA